ncbi:MAG: MMPL family transporter [Xanthomonadales bacterium]|nr:MMPL family transporter [Xanthomonadales bacterium]
MIKRHLTELGCRFPRAVYLLTLALILVLGAQLPGIVVDTDPENMLPADQPDRVFHNEVKSTFELHDAIVVGVVNESDPAGVFNPDSLAAMNRVTRGILRIDGVIGPDLMALGTVDNIEQAGPGTVSFQWLMREAPDTQDQADEIRAQVARLPLLRNTLVSDDGRAAAIYVPIADKDESHRIASEIRVLTEETPAADEYYLTGLPVAEDTFGVEMFIQMGISAPLAALVIFLLMWAFFRNLRLVIAPMIVAMATVISTMGLLIGLGFTVHIMSSMIPIFLMPIAVVDSIHIMSEFADTYRPGSDRRTVIVEVVDNLFKPMLFTSITSAVGFLSLALTPIPPVQVFGVFVAVGIILAFVLTIVFIPAYIVRMKPGSLDSMQEALHAGDDAGLLSRILRPTGRFAVQRGPAIIGIVVLIFAVSVAGILRIQINDNPVRWFKSDHRIRVADRVLNDHFAGTYDAFYVFQREVDPQRAGKLVADLRAKAEDTTDAAVADALESAALELEQADSLSGGLTNALTVLDDALWEVSSSVAGPLEEARTTLEQTQEETRYFLDPEALAYLGRFQDALLATGQVGKTNAVTDLVKTVNRELRSGEADDFRIPESQAGVAQTLLQYQSSHRPQDLWHMVTPDYGEAVVWLQLTSGDNQDMRRVMQAAEKFFDENPIPEGVRGRWAGKTYINVVWQEAMVAGMLNSLLGAFVIVLIMMVVLFRSLLFGLIAMLPLTVTITFIYGLIGWVGKDYDMPIAVLSALTLGLSIDFAIHFLQRSREIFSRTGSLEQTLREMFEEPARAITRNAIVIAVGFTPLLFAPLVPYITVGFFLAAIMAVSGAVTLILLPAMARLLGNRMYPTEHGSGRQAEAT